MTAPFDRPDRPARPHVAVRGESTVDDRPLVVYARPQEPVRCVVLTLSGFMQGPATDLAQRLASEGMAAATYDYAHPHDAAAASFALADIAAAVARAAARCRTICPNAQVVLLGYSQGGRIALSVMRDHADAVDAVILESAGIGPADEASRAAFAERSATWAERIASQGLPAFVDWWETLPLFATQAQLPADVRAAIREERLANEAHMLEQVLDGVGQQHMACASDNRALIASWKKPLMYVAGSRDEKYTEIARSLAQAGVRTVSIDAGHDVHLEAPVEFERTVRDFSDREVL